MIYIKKKHFIWDKIGIIIWKILITEFIPWFENRNPHPDNEMHEKSISILYNVCNGLFVIGKNDFRTKKNDYISNIFGKY